MGFLLLLICISTPRTTFGSNSQKFFPDGGLKEYFKNHRKGVWNLTCCYCNGKIIILSSSHVVS